MGKKTEAIFVLNENKKNAQLFREEGQTGDWKTDPKATVSTSIYVQNDALTNKKVGAKIRVTIEELE